MLRHILAGGIDCHLSNKIGFMPKPYQSIRETTLHTKLQSLAENPSGFSVSEISGYSPEHVRRAAEALVGAQSIVRRQVSPRRVRYFANEQLAESYAAASRARAPTLGPRFKATWRQDEPGLITAQTKIYVAPPPPGVLRTNTYPQM
jgi:hypothetical protein